MIDECDYEERYQEAMNLINEGEAMLDALEQEMIQSRVGTGIHIIEGCYYTTRNGKRVGPMRRLTPEEHSSDYVWTSSPVGIEVCQNVWTSEGFYMCDDWRPDDKDLVCSCES